MAIKSAFLEVMTKVNLIDARNIGLLYFEKIFSLKDHSLTLKRLVQWDQFDTLLWFFLSYFLQREGEALEFSYYDF